MLPVDIAHEDLTTGSLNSVAVKRQVCVGRPGGPENTLIQFPPFWKVLWVAGRRGRRRPASIPLSLSIYIYICMYSMYIHMCIYTYIYIYTHIHICIYTHAYTYTLARTCRFTATELSDPAVKSSCAMLTGSMYCLCYLFLFIFD